MAVKVLFCFYPLYVWYNHGIALLSSLCKTRGIDVSLHLLDDFKAFSERLQSEKYDYIGFSCVTVHDYQKSVPFISMAKSSGFKTMLGGVYARQLLVNNPDVDFLCRGEGENLPDFLLSGDRSVFDGIQKCSDLNSLPLPDYDLFDNIPFERGFPFLKDKKILPYYSSRGCPYRCSFCLTQLQSRNMRFRCKVEDDLTEIRDKYAPDLFFIGDELLPYYNRRWRESWGDFSYPFIAYIRADIKPDHLQWLIDRGMEACAFGVESGDEKYRNEVLKKDLSDSDLYRTVAELNRNDIPFIPFYMEKTPQETFLIRQKTYRMSKDLGGYPMVFEYEHLVKGRL